MFRVFSVTIKTVSTVVLAVRVTSDSSERLCLKAGTIVAGLCSDKKYRLAKQLCFMSVKTGLVIKISYRYRIDFEYLTSAPSNL